MCRSGQAKRLESAVMMEEGLNSHYRSLTRPAEAFPHGAIESLTEVAAVEVRTERIQRGSIAEDCQVLST